MSGDNEKLIEIYDYYGDVIDTIPLDKFSVSKTIGAFIIKVCTILIALEIVIPMMAGIGIINGYDIIIIFVIIVVQIILIYQALQRYYDDTMIYRSEKALYILKEKRICSLSKSIGIMIILNIFILIFNHFVHNLNLQEFKTQISVSEKTKDAQIEDMTIKVVAGESSPSYEYKVCHDLNCGTHVSKENIIADKYDVEQITTTVITPDKIKKEMISYKFIFLKDKPIVDTFKSKDDFYKQAYAEYRFSHMIKNLNLGIVIFLEELCLAALVFYIKKYKGQEDTSSFNDQQKIGEKKRKESKKKI